MSAMLSGLTESLPNLLCRPRAFGRVIQSAPTCFSYAQKACQVFYFEGRILVHYMVLRMAVKAHPSRISFSPMIASSLQEVVLVVWRLWNLLLTFIVRVLVSCLIRTSLPYSLGKAARSLSNKGELFVILGEE